jgi:hypothetical protein
MPAVILSWLRDAFETPVLEMSHMRSNNMASHRSPLETLTKAPHFAERPNYTWEYRKNDRHILSSRERIGGRNFCEFAFLENTTNDPEPGIKDHILVFYSA